MQKEDGETMAFSLPQLHLLPCGVPILIIIVVRIAILSLIPPFRLQAIAAYPKAHQKTRECDSTEDAKC